MNSKLIRNKAKFYILHRIIFALFVVCFINSKQLFAQDSFVLISPTKNIEFKDAYAGWQVVVSKSNADVTRSASYKTLNPQIAKVDVLGFVEPVGDGQTIIQVVWEGKTLEVPVSVQGISNGRPIDFRTEVVPLLSKLGCNAGGCHGKASGQNGFKLSLFGFDANFDFESIVNEARGRRVFPANPEKSLLIQKASGQMPHGGGKRLIPGSNEYLTIQRWIAAGTPAVAKDNPTVKKIRLFPQDRTYKFGDTQQVAVVAEYTDGTFRDVTRQSEFASNLDVVGLVDPSGLVKAGQLSGEAAIMARHMGNVAVSRVLVPHGKPLSDLPGFNPINEIDQLMMAKWKKLGLQPTPVCDDSTFIRRLTVDLCGRLPTPDEVKVFLKSTDSDKRTKLADTLLDSADYPAYFAMKWGSILRNSNLAGSDRASYAFHNWIKDMVARNRPYDEFVRGVVAASGEWQDAPAINWYWQSRDDQLHQVAADTSQIFLGVRLQCARCHHHPYERWGQADYYGLTGFFTRLGRKGFGEPPPYYSSASVTTSEKNPLTGKTPEPKFLDGDNLKFSAEDDPRHSLVDWMAKPDNPFFSKALVNRLWGHFFARGLFQEVDDLRETNPPSNPELLDFLAKEFVSHKFDIKYMIRLLITSRVYQSGSDPTEHNKNDYQNFARYYARRMPSEVFLDAVNQATGNKAGFSGISANGRAIDLPHENFGSYFLDTFDRPKRVTACECERSTGATLAQVLLLANSDEMEGKITAAQGRLAKLTKLNLSQNDLISELYLSSFSRLPTTLELLRTNEFISKSNNKQQSLEDLLWVILNSKEFMFNH